MFSVSPEIYQIISPAAHYLFAFFALMLLFFALLWLYDERRKHRNRFRSLPEAGNIGEMVVISGSDQLPADTWFPVPREGILGSLRSCDLVVPCPGVRARHLAFSWQDGTGLIVKPFAGCETFVDGISLITAGKAGMPVMVHGSCLQVGSAVLRLQLLSALEHTNRPFLGNVPPPDSIDPPADSLPLPYTPLTRESGPYITDQPAPDGMVPSGPLEQEPDHVPEASAVLPVQGANPVGLTGSMPVPEESAPVQPPVPRRKRADRWKEDFSE